MEFEQIKELLKQLNDSTFDEFSLKEGSTVIKIKKNSNTVPHFPEVLSPSNILKPVEINTEPVRFQPSVERKVADVELHKIVSPMVGTFYAAPSPDSKLFVNVGSKINKESCVGIVEAMKLYNEIEADVEGEIVEILVENGQMVEFGQPLYLVRPSTGGASV